MPPAAYVSPGKRKAARLCRAFAEGCGGSVAWGGPLDPRRPVAFYGMTDYTMALQRAAVRAGRDWYYLDNAYYFGRGRYFRVTRNAWQCNGRGGAALDRLHGFGLRPAPFRRRGRYVLIATQSDLFYRYHAGAARADWLARLRAELARHTDRPIEVALKPAPGKGDFPHGAFERLIDGAWALVTHSSSCAVGALLRGIPVFTTAPSMADRVALRDLSRIERPHYPGDRLEWFAVLAASQWTLTEMRDGTCWRALNGLR